MILGGLAAETSFTAAEILALGCRDAKFWWNAISAFRRRQSEDQ